MFSTMILFYLGALVVCYFLYGAFVRLRSNSSMRRLPGPPGLPIIQNLLDIPRHSSWIAFKEIGKQIGTCPSVPRLPR